MLNLPTDLTFPDPYYLVNSNYLHCTFNDAFSPSA